MDVSIELPDLLSKLKVVSYGQYHIEQQHEQLSITLFTHQQAIRYLIIDSVSQAKQSELAHLLNQYRS